MWISGYVTGNSFSKDSPSVGVVRASGSGKVSVSATNEHLAVPVALPYGIAYAPPVGSQSVVLPYSAGGASIVLKNDGRVLINGRAVE